MRQSSALVGLVLILAGCSDYQRAIKSTNLDYKFMVAHNYYIDKEYERAIPLLEELVSLTRGTELSECVYYLHAKSIFGSKDYMLASYYLANFSRTFPTSEFAEECAYLSAYCFYRNSPGYELDQTDTYSAINDLQLFLVRYPNSSLRDSCNTLVDKLRAKLELKEYNNGMQYYKLRNYQAAQVALESFVQNWPNSKYREVAMYTQFESAYYLARNSVEEKKAERVKDAYRAYHNFADAFGNSAYLAEATRKLKDLETHAHRIGKQQP
ncbi:MAG: outer membrane protein assembly factor BamD [Flavobacteriales bacterium]|nr:outer membrane protein assembly factor BamD [Flavobacteriales bacterium]